MGMKLFIAFLLFGLCGCSMFAASPSFSSFDPSQFSTQGFNVTIKSGAPIANAVLLGIPTGNGVGFTNVMPALLVWKTNGTYFNYSNNIVGALTNASDGDIIMASAGHFFINERCNVGSPGSSGVTRAANVSLIMNPGTWIHTSNSVEMIPTIHPGNNFLLQGGNSICHVTNFTTFFLGRGASGTENNVPFSNVVVRDHNGYGQSDWYYSGASTYDSVEFINSKFISRFDCVYVDQGVHDVTASGSTFVSTADSPLITVGFSRCEAISFYGGGHHRFMNCRIICNTNTTGYPTYGVYFGNTVTKGTNLFLSTTISAPTNAIFSVVANPTNNVIYGSYFDEVLKTFVVY